MRTVEAFDSGIPKNNLLVEYEKVHGLLSRSLEAAEDIFASAAKKRITSSFPHAKRQTTDRFSGPLPWRGCSVFSVVSSSMTKEEMGKCLASLVDGAVGELSYSSEHWFVEHPNDTLVFVGAGKYRIQPVGKEEFKFSLSRDYRFERHGG